MKTAFTLQKQGFLAIVMFAVFLMFSFGASATIYTVAVSNYKFEPKEITINEGDTVVWVNSDGHHNVDGMKTAYPSNPESFGNDAGMDWTYQFIFSTAGTYNYQCDPHVGFGMVGKITVNQKQTTSTQIAEKSDRIRVFPNPAKEFINLSIPTSMGSAQMLKIYSITGSLVDTKTISGNSAKYNLAQLKSGVYFVEIQTSDKKEVIKFIRQ